MSYENGAFSITDSILLAIIIFDFFYNSTAYASK